MTAALLCHVDVECLCLLRVTVQFAMKQRDTLHLDFARVESCGCIVCFIKLVAAIIT